jgi:hypothetical protein
MVKPALRHTLEAVLVLIGVAAALAAALGLRLSQGPIALPGLKPAVEHFLSGQVEGGKAVVGDARLVWFPDTQAIGVRLKNVALTDGRGRTVLRAASVEGATALDSTLLLAPAPARLTANGFFAAVSISPQGKFALGYDASGAPERVGGVDRTLSDLTGEAHRSRPLSYLRDLHLSNGVLAFRQVGGPVAWASRIDQVYFHKGGGRIASDCRLVFDDGQRKSTLNLTAQGAMGLKDARLTGVVADLSPARIFPTVGATRPLSALDALVQGRGTLDYAASRGVTAADVVFTAGAGRLRFGSAFQRFDSAQVAGGYDPRTQEVRLTQFKVAAERTRLDVAGKMKLIPEHGKDAPAHLAFELTGPDGLVTLAPSAPPQPVQDLYVRGDYTPELGHLILDEARLSIAGAPLSGRLELQRDKRNPSSWGVKANAAIGGTVGPEQILAFWPEGFVQGPRKWVQHSLLAGRARDVRVVADIPPGAKGPLSDQALRMDFNAEGVEVRILDDLAHLTEVSGVGVLHANNLNIRVTSGKMQNVTIKDGLVDLPRFDPKGARAVFRAHAVGDAREILQIVDGPKTKLISAQGFDPTRVSGQADIQMEITRPMLGEVPAKDYGVHYYGRVVQAGLKQAAIGLDLHDADLAVDGSAQALSVKGTGQAGPYHGNVDFKSDFTGKAGMVVDMDGSVDVAGAVGGGVSGGAPLTAHFTANHGVGTGTIHSRPLDGRVEWADQKRVEINGTAQSAGWRQAGVPVAAAMPGSFPIRLVVDRTGDKLWTGRLEADAYSGAIAWTDGDPAKLRYTAQITPEEARRLGFGRSPAFSHPQSVSADVALAPNGSAAYVIGPMSGKVEWVMTPKSTLWRWKTVMDRDDMAAMGVPGFFAPASPTPVEASFTAVGSGIAGDLSVAGAVFKVALNDNGGRKVVTLDGSPDESVLERLGLLPDVTASGPAGISGHFEGSSDGRWSGRVSADLSRMAVAIDDTEWRKTIGKPGRLSMEIATNTDGAVSLNHIEGQAPGLVVDAQASVVKGQLVSFSTRTARIDGVFDGSVQVTREGSGGLIRLNGRLIDTRPVLKRLTRRESAGGSGASGGSGAGGQAATPWRVDAQFAQARITDVGTLNDLKVNGQAGRLDVSATTPGGSALSLKLYPEGAGTGFSAKIGDISQVGAVFFGQVPLRGGEASATGRLAEGGFDAQVDMQKVRVLKAPVMVQLVTLASLRGLADTLNGEGVEFDHVSAPMRVRGGKVYLDDARATGSAMGVTTKGVIDLDAHTLDLSGVVAPSYALNSAMGRLPVVGALFNSRKGEGLVGITYQAKGSTKAPKVSVNPFSLAAPGILRRIFEPTHRPDPAKAGP